MPKPILIIGKSGAGKSSAMESLPPKETFLFNVCNKDLPFRSGLKDYTERDKASNPNGNMLTTSDYSILYGSIEQINTKTTHIKNIIIDDSQYLIVTDFLDGIRTKKKGNETYELFNYIGLHFIDLVNLTKSLRPDLFVYYLHHIDVKDDGSILPKTMGKILNERVDIAGLFTIVLYAKKEDGEYIFYTQNDGMSPTKSPKGMFKELTIPNDLLLVKNTINNYYKGV